MKIYDIATPFVEQYEPTIDFLENYFAQHEPHFKEYFNYHCKNIEQKLQDAPARHALALETIQANANALPTYIEQITKRYKERYDVDFIRNVHIIVGLYGSNAYTHRDVDPPVTFCVEKLSSKSEHLQTIVAHEFGHATHCLLSTKHGIDWANVDWQSPYTWLLQEGAATYLSMQVVDVRDDIYFAYEDDVEWLAFARANEQQIVQAFREHLVTTTIDAIFKEWFSINGGATFGYTRLGYYIGYIILQNSIVQNGELKALTLWKEVDFKMQMQALLAKW